MERMILPERSRGGQSYEAKELYESNLESFCETIERIRSSLDSSPTSRGWCYLLEDDGLIKSDFDKAQEIIGECRKNGMLPLDIVSEDTGRVFYNEEKLHLENVKEQAQQWVDWLLLKSWENYMPFSFWDDQEYYIQMLVEKTDLVNLFLPVCKRFRIPIANTGGWADVTQRGKMMERFRDWEKLDHRPVLLYCGDHDPAGLNISDTLPRNIKDLSCAIDWTPDNLIIDRFGLNYDLIKKLGLTWIDGLYTSSKDSKGNPRNLADPKHPDHKKPYVQNYKRIMLEHGEDTWEKKCEANALIKRPIEGRKVCLYAILKYLLPDSPETYEAKMLPHRKKIQRAIMKKVRA